MWVIYIAMQTGVPAKPAANVLKLAPGFKPHFAWLPLIVAIVATIAWLWLVRWRTARHRAALWRSLVLPAGGVVLAWNLAMTLWLQPLDYARSYRAHVALLSKHIPPGVCISAPGCAACTDGRAGVPRPLASRGARRCGRHAAIARCG